VSERVGTSGTTYVGGTPEGEPAYCHELASLSHTEVERILALERRKIAIIPVGSTEAHGPHLPLGSDSLISEEVARRASFELAKHGFETVWFPSLHYTVTECARPFKGTTSISKEATAMVLLDACVSAKEMGFDRVVIVSAHLEPTHLAALRKVAADYEEKTGEALVFPDTTKKRWAERLTDEYRSGSCHAGQYETSLLLAIRPELVNAEVAAELPALDVPLHKRLVGGKNFEDVGMTQAYCGNPAGATVDEGMKTLEILAGIVTEAIEESFEAD
jgi:creatinine amidohydrolase